MNLKSAGVWILRIVPAIIMLQTLYFKFTGHAESVKLFTILNMEPWGRIGTGVMELIASVLLLYPKTTKYGALLGAGLMSGALFFHLSNKNVGINYGGDSLLFMYALITFICCSILVLYYKKELLAIVRK